VREGGYEMVHVLCVLASARQKGYTAKLLDSVANGIQSVRNVDYEVVHIHEYLPISPCISCWNCLRKDKHTCTLNDSMGKQGKGELFQKVADTNALFIAQPVYFGRPPASVHLFFERFYPFMWSRELNGMPFASLSQAGNNGYARSADMAMARWAYTWYLRYVGGIPVHLIYYEEAKKQSHLLGKKLAEAAIEDAEERLRISPLDRLLGAHGNPWSSFEPTIENLTNGTYSYEGSLINYALKHGTVKKEKAIDLMIKAGEELKLALHYYKLGDNRQTAEYLIKTRGFFSPATSKEFLEEEVQSKRGVE
jgi:multimeric flavodoxin WrbA